MESSEPLAERPVEKEGVVQASDRPQRSITIRRYCADVELRQLEAFVAVATELHFGRAAARLHLGQPTVSESIRRLERELGTPLFTRTTRHVALTSAGEEFLIRTKTILDEVSGAAAAVRRVAHGDVGTVRVGITPPVAPILLKHLQDEAAPALPGVDLDVRKLWLPALAAAVADASIDVAITCGVVPDADGVVSEIFCGEPLLVGLRPGHRLAAADAVALGDLEGEVLGSPDADLFPAWALSQQQALATAGVAPPTAGLEASDLAAAGWTEQAGVDWVLLMGSLARSHTQTVIREVRPAQLVPFTLQWSPHRAQTAAVARFVHFALTLEPPTGWMTQPGHLRHR